jgi:hypothetical protein
MAGVRLTAFKMEDAEPGVMFGDLAPLDLFEANGEPFFKADTTKLDNAISLRSGKPGQFASHSNVTPIDMVVTKTGISYERRKPKQAKPKGPTTPVNPTT